MRIALVTRRYWPMVGGAEMAMANLAHEFAKQGHTAVVVTAQWERTWPTEIEHRGVPVIRLPQPRTRGWGTWRYVQGLKRWLIHHRMNLDVVLVSMLKHDAFAVVTSRGKHRLPVVLRAEGAGETGDIRWQETGRFGRWIRRATLEAQAFIAPSRTILEEMMQAGYDPQRATQIDNGVAVSTADLPAQARQQARRSLGDWNASLQADDDHPVVVFTGRLHEAKGLRELLEAWKIVRQSQPRARLWLIGEGDLAPELARRSAELGLDNSVVMPGVFDDVDELLTAADLFVLPSHQEGLSLSLLEAMSHSLPCIVSDIPGNRQAIEHDREGLLVPVRHIESLAGAILQLIARPDERARLGAAAKLAAASRFSIERMASEHLEVLRRVSLVDREVRA